MTTEPRPPSPAPVAARPRRPALAVGALVAVLLLVAAGVLVRGAPSSSGGSPCTVVADGVRPPAVVLEAVDRLRAGVLADVAGLDVVCSGPDVAAGDPDAPDPRVEPSLWVVAVDAAAPGADGLVAAARAVLDGAPAGAPFGWDLRVRDTARSAEVVLAAGGGTALVADAVALRGVPGVAEVWFGPDSGRVAVAAAADVAPLLQAAAGRNLPVTTVETRDTWAEVRQVQPGSWPPPDAVALALDVAAWDGVWRLLLDGGEPASPSLTVHVEDDAQRAWVASRLDVLVGPAVAYHVTSPAATVDGVVGGRPQVPGAAAAAAPDGVPACPAEGLTVQVVGTDAAAGSRFLMLRATHTGAAPCVLQGVPALAFTRASGTTVPDLTQLPDLGAAATAPAVVLAPGASADAVVRWRAMSTSQDPDVSVAVTVRAVAGGPVVDLPLTGTLDVLAGATVKVGPWGAAG